jgi:uncharacterized DUF497 family protein
VIIGELEWDDENIEHIARHNVTPEEVEDVCYGSHLSERVGGGRYVLSAKSATGRYLNVVIQRIGRGLFRPITAFEMSDSYKMRYRKRFKK